MRGHTPPTSTGTVFPRGRDIGDDDVSRPSLGPSRFSAISAVHPVPDRNWVDPLRGQGHARAGFSRSLRGWYFFFFLQRLILKLWGGDAGRVLPESIRWPPGTTFGAALQFPVRIHKLFHTVEKTQPRKKQDGGTFVLIFPLRVHSVCGG